MTEQNSPICLEVNTNCFLMEGMRGVLDFRFVNRITDESFKVESRLTSHLFQSPRKKTLTLSGGQATISSFPMNLPGKSEKANGSAGRTLVEVELIIDAGDDGKHRYTGEFPLTILEHTTSRREVNVNIGKVIEQHGDKAGMGGINEVDLNNMIKLPGSLSVNQLLEQDRPPRFVEIELEYEGTVDESTIHPRIIQRPDIEPLDRCAIAGNQSELKTLILAPSSMTIGRSRDKADLTIWIMPLDDEENYRRTRMISQEQVKLCLDHENSPGIRLLSHVNRSRLDDIPLERRTPVLLPINHKSTLHLHDYFALTITPIPMPTIPADWQDAWLADVDAETHQRWTWSTRNKIGGYLIERNDALRDRERYIWLIAAVTHTSVNSEINLLQINNQLMTTTLDGNRELSINNQTIKEGEAMPIGQGDQCLIGDTEMTITSYEQRFP